MLIVLKLSEFFKWQLLTTVLLCWEDKFESSQLPKLKDLKD